MAINGHGRLRIAQVAPLHESVPPRLYGGTERIVSYLTEELVAAGHDVTLFASGDSQTSARLVAGCPRALRLAHCADTLAPHLAMVEQVARRARDFDLVHFHIDYLHFPVSSRERYRHVTTLHGRLDLPDIVPVFARFGDLPVVSISDAQREPLPDLGWQGTVYHGFPEPLYRFEPTPGDYLAFLGRISPEKGIDQAIEIARRTGHRLRVAAKIDRADRDYYTRYIAAQLRQPHVEFLGEIGERDKQELLGGALALLFPINWPEPFGMVMPEAMACGTPVIAYRGGAVPEVLDHGVSGFVCDGIDQAVEAVGRVHELSRTDCRRTFEHRFTAARMADDYAAIYRRLLQPGERDDHGHDGIQAGESRRLHDPRHQLASR
ncbi:MAG TPA: glycosyltransferase family 4 protein [Kofleriaceae bacterium]|jgi:glycosyltransferase involved in cell wall biosynthesis|nr:glycosyltransferase family 4 protein [Kofleriaceae bacterium]